MLQLLLRTLGVLILGLGAMIGAATFWPTLQYVFGSLFHVDQVSLDTLVLSGGLAAGSVGQAVILLVLPPLLVAAWAGHYAMRQRLGAAVTAIVCGVAVFSAGEAIVSLSSGYVFSMRHSVAHAYTFVEYALLAACLAGEWVFMFKRLPVRGGFKRWLGLGP